MRKTNKNKIEVFEIENEGNYTDWGQVYSWKCPFCKESLQTAEYDNDFSQCSCGYVWTFVVKAVGEIGNTNAKD